MGYVLTSVGILVCAVQALRTRRLLISALWLAGTSALTALLLYLLGAPQVAVIELSVGAGLVTVLFVFAINIAGEEALDLQPVLPKPLAWTLVAAAVVLLGWMAFPAQQVPPGSPVGGVFSTSFWEERKLDVLLQVVLIFSGVMGVLGLLSEGKPAEEVK